MGRRSFYNEIFIVSDEVIQSVDKVKDESFQSISENIIHVKEESDTVLLDVSDQEIQSGYYAINEGEDGKSQLQPIIKV